MTTTAASATARRRILPGFFKRPAPVRTHTSLQLPRAPAHRSTIPCLSSRELELVSGAIRPFRPMMGRHDYGSAIGHYCLYVAPERSTRRAIHTGERLVQQKQIRMTLGQNTTQHQHTNEQFT